MSCVLPWVLAVLSGGLLGLCYPPFGLGDLCWVALTPLVWAVWFCPAATRRDWLRTAGLGYACGLVFFAMSAHWLTTLTWPGYLLLVLYFAFYFAAWTLFARALVPHPSQAEECWLGSIYNLRVCVLGASGWVALEWLRGVIFPAFGWNGLGIALHGNIALIQIADITGVGGISFLVAMTNLMLVATVKRLLLEIKRGARRAHYDFAVTIALVALTWTYGVRKLFTPEPPSDPLSFAAVQPNIPQNVRNDPGFEIQVLETLKTQTLPAIAMAPDLILWPESSTPSPLLGNQFTWDLVRGLAEQHTGDFLIGTTHFGSDGDYNSIALLTKQGKEAQLHHKIHLVPFGEYVPLREEFPLLAKIVGDLVPSDFDAGKEFTLLELQSKPVKLGPLVCFEDTVPDLARQFALLGAQSFVVVTNDGWFLQSAGSQQHLNNAIFRCVENKIPMIRAANTGVTCAIDRLGVVREVLRDPAGSTFLQGVLFSKINAPTSPEPTFFARHGEVFSISCLIVSLLSLAVSLIRMRKNSKSSCSNPSETKTSTL
ncbi:MAG: apolipoprotein N-acyltransferase [Spartobacteria bacterium]